MVMGAVMLPGCTRGPTITESSAALLEVPVAIDAAAVRIGYPVQELELRVQPYFIGAGGVRVPIGERQTVSLASTASQARRIEVQLDVSACLRQQNAAGASTGICPLHLDIVLFLANGGLTLDQQRVGPFDVLPRARTSVPDTVHVREVGAPDVLPSSPLVAVGDSLRLTARFVTVRGDTVMRPVTWVSEQPQVATVDSTGLIRGVAAGTADINANFGNGQSSNGQRVTVRNR
jgi:Bacterial Ig-like domain (group 2)